MHTPLLELNNLTIGFSRQNQYLPAITDLSFAINKGKTLALLGESGCGKSLTSLAIMQLLPAQATIMGPAQIKLNGQDLLALCEAQMTKVRGKKIAMIFQEPMTSLNPVMTIGAQLKEALLLHTKLTKKQITPRILDLLHQGGLPKPVRHISEYPHQLSGGMKQRVMIAIALAGEPY